SMVRGIANSKIGFGDLILLLRYFFKLKVSTHPIHLAKKLGLTVTAEGVETQQQVEILTRLGCQQFQGYLLGMPVNVGQLIQSQGAHFV
ncbi:EAL domain-containing protein, partial [Acinetobacter baumannii]|nr:EAL domain-containing protein [Acinetobacter baumannii]